MGMPTQKALQQNQQTPLSGREQSPVFNRQLSDQGDNVSIRSDHSSNQSTNQSPFSPPLQRTVSAPQASSSQERQRQILQQQYQQLSSSQPPFQKQLLQTPVQQQQQQTPVKQHQQRQQTLVQQH